MAEHAEEDFEALLNEYLPTEHDLTDKAEGVKGPVQFKSSDIRARADTFETFFRRVTSQDPEYMEGALEWLSDKQPNRMYSLLRVAVGILDRTSYSMDCLKIIAGNNRISEDHKFSLATFLGMALVDEGARERASAVLDELPVDIAAKALRVQVGYEDPYAQAAQDYLRKLSPADTRRYLTSSLKFELSTTGSSKVSIMNEDIIPVIAENMKIG